MGGSAPSQPSWQRPHKVAVLWVERQTGRKRQQEARDPRQVMDGCSKRVGWGEGFGAGSLSVCVCLSVIICDGLGRAAAAAGSMLRSTGQAGAEAC